MAEHLLQQTLTPEMAVMADYYEQGVAPPTAATAAAGRYFRHTVDGQLRPGATLDELVSIEAARLGESALGRDGRAVESDELRLRALAAFTAAGMIPYDEALASLARLTGEMPAERMDAAIQEAVTERDYSSATATPRRDMNPALANRLASTPIAGLRPRRLPSCSTASAPMGRILKAKKSSPRRSPSRNCSGSTPQAGRRSQSWSVCWRARRSKVSPWPETRQAGQSSVLPPPWARNRKISRRRSGKTSSRAAKPMAARCLTGNIERRSRRTNPGSAISTSPSPRRIALRCLGLGTHAGRARDAAPGA